MDDGRAFSRENLHAEAYDLNADGKCAEAIDLLRVQIEDGDAIACVIALGIACEAKDVPRQSELVTELRLALVQMAEGGNAQAQWELSQSLRFGNYFDQDTQTANDWLRRAAESGDADARYHLAAYMQHELFGLAGDEQDIRNWKASAVEQRHPEALYEEALEKLDWDNPAGAIELLSAPELKEFRPARDLLERLKN